MKTSKHAGQRSVRLIDAHTLLLVDHDGEGELYDLQRVGRNLAVQKIDADGVKLSETYFVHLGPDRCTCRGHKFGYACKHIAALNALTAVGRLPLANNTDRQPAA